MKNGSLEKCLLQSPERYAGIDYLLGLNHGISATTGPKHSIAKSFLDTLRDIFQHCKGQYSFTLSFFTTGDPAEFAPKSGEEFRAFMEMAQGRDRVFKNVFVQVVQVPKTRTAWRKFKRCGVCCRACGVQNKISGMGAWAGMGSFLLVGCSGCTQCHVAGVQKLVCGCSPLLQSARSGFGVAAVRWPAEGRRQLVPGTSLRWSDIFRAGAAFPNNKSVLVPRLWWCEDTNIKDAIRNDLKELNIDLEGLLPDSLQLLNSPTRGATERGEKWEELVASSLAARFRLHCIARNLSAEVTWDLPYGGSTFASCFGAVRSLLE